MMELLVVVLAVALAVMLYFYCQERAMLKATRKGDMMKHAFLTSVSHEIRSPLKAVSELADIVSQDNLYLSKNEKRNISEQLRFNADLIKTLFDEVMVFTDADSEGHLLKDEMFSPNALCRRCLEGNMRSIYHRQAVRLTFKRELSDEFFVKSDRHIVELIVNKLILNACRFTEEGEVTVGCNTSEQDGQLSIFVSDTGVGIPETRISSLFSWFEAPDQMKDEAELDLSVCQRLAQKLGGSLFLDDRQQVGTRMVLQLPLKR